MKKKSISQGHDETYKKQKHIDKIRPMFKGKYSTERGLNMYFFYWRCWYWKLVPPINILAKSIVPYIESQSNQCYTLRNMRSSKTQISFRIWAAWSEIVDSQESNCKLLQIDTNNSDRTVRMHKIIWVSPGENVMIYFLFFLFFFFFFFFFFVQNY